MLLKNGITNILQKQKKKSSTSFQAMTTNASKNVTLLVATQNA
jgi:hypothetical protein